MVLTINGRKIGTGHPPYIIAEMSANHNGNIDRALQTIQTAKKSGADAVKLQTYSADTMTIDCEKSDFKIQDGLWAGRSLYELYRWAETPFSWMKKLFDHGRQIEITVFSTPFDETAVDLLEDLNAPAYKIASFEAVDLPLIRYVGQTKKPLIISTGLCSKEEVDAAVNTALDAGSNGVAVLHCVSSYPAPIDEANLSQIKTLQNRLGVPIGLSDHTLGNTAAVVATGLGAALIEKHFTLSRDDGGPDSEFSIEPNELETLCHSTKEAWKSIGVADWSRPHAEKGNEQFRRSLYFVKKLKKGAKVSASDIRRIRPGYGLAPKFFDNVVGQRLLKDVEPGERVSWNLITKDDKE